MRNTIKERMNIVAKLAQDDIPYRQMQIDMRAIERKYNAVLSKLSAEDQNSVCDFVSQCEEMSWRMLELACSLDENMPPE